MPPSILYVYWTLTSRKKIEQCKEAILRKRCYRLTDQRTELNSSDHLAAQFINLLMIIIFTINILHEAWVDILLLLLGNISIEISASALKVFFVCFLFTWLWKRQFSLFFYMYLSLLYQIIRVTVDLVSWSI